MNIYQEHIKKNEKYKNTDHKLENIVSLSDVGSSVGREGHARQSKAGKKEKRPHTAPPQPNKAIFFLYLLFVNTNLKLKLNHLCSINIKGVKMKRQAVLLWASQKD